MPISNPFQHGPSPSEEEWARQCWAEFERMVMPDGFVFVYSHGLPTLSPLHKRVVRYLLSIRWTPYYYITPMDGGYLIEVKYNHKR